MPSRQTNLRIAAQARALAEAQFGAQIAGAKGAIAQNTANQEQGIKQMGGYMDALKSLYNKPVDNTDYNVAKNDVAAIAGQYAPGLAASNSGAANYADKAAQNMQQYLSAQLLNRGNSVEAQRGLLGARAQDKISEANRFYEQTGQNRQGALDSLRSQYGAARSANQARLTEAQVGREFQAAQAREARTFQAAQNKLARQAQEAQSQRQYDLAIRQMKQNQRQFNATSARHKLEYDNQANAPVVFSAGDQDKIDLAKNALIPRWIKKFGGKGKGKYEGAALNDAMEKMAVSGIKLGVLSGRNDPNEDYTQISPRLFAEALRLYNAPARKPKRSSKKK